MGGHARPVGSVRAWRDQRSCFLDASEYITKVHPIQLRDFSCRYGLFEEIY